jgi:hypothetical protein
MNAFCVKWGEIVLFSSILQIPHIHHPTKKCQLPYIVTNYAISLNASFEKMASGNQMLARYLEKSEYKHA